MRRDHDAVMQEAAIAGTVRSWRDALPRLAAFATLATIAGIGAWLAAIAVYRADDYGLIHEAWRGGDFGAALAHWLDLHVTPWSADAWPKFYRPVWSASYFVDAHVFGCEPAWSTLLSWTLHAATAWLAGRLCLRLTGSPAARWLTTWLCLLPGAAQQAVFWIAARGTLLATFGTIAALVVAVAPPRLRTARLAAIAALVLLAAGGNEVGLFAAPVVAAAILLRPDETWRERLAAAAVPVLVMGAWVCWRRAMLGEWVGGYAPTGHHREWSDVLTSFVAGAGSVAWPGHDALGRFWQLGTGAVVFAAMAAFVLRRCAARGHRVLVALAALLILLFLAPFAGSEFRTSNGTNGRYLHPAHFGVALAIPAVLHGCAARLGPRVAGGLASLLLTWIVVAFAATAVAFDRASATARSLFTALAAFPGEELTVLLHLPDQDDGFLIARNALPAAMQPPFRAASAAPFAHATDFDLANCILSGLSPALQAMPGAATWHWQPAERRFAAGWWSAQATWRGRISARPDGSLQCGGTPIVVDGPAAAAATAGAWVELHCEVLTAGLRCAEVLPWTPLLQAEGGAEWRYRGRPGDWVFLLAGAEPCCVALGPAGSFGIARPLVVPAGVADANGTFVFTLPAAAAGARLLQTLVLSGAVSRATIGEVHELLR